MFCLHAVAAEGVEGADAAAGDEGGDGGGAEVWKICVLVCCIVSLKSMRMVWEGGMRTAGDAAACCEAGEDVGDCAEGLVGEGGVSWVVRWGGDIWVRECTMIVCD